MKKKLYLNLTIWATTLLFLTTNGMNQQQQAESFISAISTKFNIIKQKKGAQLSPSDIEKVNSPEVQKDKNRSTQQLFQSIYKDAEQLDTLSTTLPQNQQAALQKKQSEILEPAKTVLKAAITETLQSTWQQQGKAIAQAALNIVAAGVTTAGIGLVTQGIQMGTGNLLALDTNTLLITGLSSVATATLTALSAKGEFLRATSVGALNESLITPSVTNYKYTFEIPSASGPIIRWMTTEATALATTMIEQGGGMGKILGNINLTQTLLPTVNRKLGAPSNTLVATALPHVQAIIKNQKIASVLTEIGWIAMQSAAVGGLMHMAGFGFADSSMTQSVGYAVLTGVAQGTLATVITLGRILTPGAIINITSAPLAQQAMVIAGGTQQAAITAVIQATITEVSNVLLEETRKQGGLLETLQKGKNLLGQSFISRWSGTWASITDAWETIQSIDPIPL